MEIAEIRHIEDYLGDLEEGLELWVHQGPPTLGDLNRLHVIIERLVNAIYETDNQELRPNLVSLESKARRCKKCIEKRLAVRN